MCTVPLRRYVLTTSKTVPTQHLLVRTQYLLERRYSVPLTKAYSCSTSKTVPTLYLLDITYTVFLRSMYSLSLRPYVHCTSQTGLKPYTVPVRQYVFSISQLVPTLCLRNLKHYVWDNACKVPSSFDFSSLWIRSDSWSFSWRSWIWLLSSSETEEGWQSIRINHPVLWNRKKAEDQSKSITQSSETERRLTISQNQSSSPLKQRELGWRSVRINHPVLSNRGKWESIIQSSETEGRLTVNQNQSSSPLKQREGWQSIRITHPVLWNRGKADSQSSSPLK